MTVNNDYALRDKGASNSLEASLLPRHRWYSYKEGFSPSLIQHATQRLHDFNQEKDVILDPFNGSGTVTLFSGLNGYKAIGYEVNPFSAFISQVKETDLTEKEISIFNNEKDKILSFCERPKLSKLLNFSTFSENGLNDKWLFNADVLNSFESAFNYTKKITHPQIQNLIKLLLINSAMDNCNAKKDGKCLRYKNNWQYENFDKNSFIKSIELNSDIYIDDITASPIKKKSTLFTGDSRKINQKELSPFKLCITSPPYLNSFDYTDIYRPELFLGEFIENQSQLLELRKKTLRSHVNHKNVFDAKKSYGSIYDGVISNIQEQKKEFWNPKIPSMIQSYFDDMSIILNNLRTKAEKNSQLWLIVANSAYANFEIPTDLILAEIGSKSKWYLKEIGVLRYLHKRGSKYSPDISTLRESVIIFNSSPND